ncbi:condensation protein [Streptomyces sp. ISL-112]|uniref:wax ester/triacylglycerol synthase domain-containing protein n=1 Tax=unclassified Streptomyces TaxID=2593676 RepID=UPI001BE6EDCD|nr:MULTISPECIES: wax ester/triacylglycerol synthase domain-containing protein [unclassified Streptomyces]MBT2427479.1 condensation protein [Streptomyces sp. ISL-112]MBT2464514.1 condensation protein [Streptomyces sp. ISL-63]
MFDFPGQAPSLTALRARIAARAGQIASLRYRVEMRSRKACTDDHFDPDEHVFELAVTSAEALDAARRQMLTRPLPEGRPPWDVWLIRNARESFTVCFRSDHALRDGMAAAYLCRQLIEDQPHHSRLPAPSARVGLRGIAAVLGESARAMRSTSPTPALAGAEAGAQGPFHADVPMAVLRDAARAHGATVNDVYLAALSEAVRRWYGERTGRGHPPMPVTMPLSARGPVMAAAVGNALVGTRITLPCDRSRNVVETLDTVAAQTRRLREINYRHCARLVLGVLPRGLGARLTLRVAGAGPVGLLASNLDCGPVLTHFGVTARQAQMLSSLADGLRCYTALTGYGDNARLSVVHDESLPAAPRLGEHWVAAVHELASLSSPPRHPPGEGPEEGKRVSSDTKPPHASPGSGSGSGVGPEPYGVPHPEPDRSLRRRT